MRKYLLCCLGLCRRSPGRKCTLTTVQNEQFGKSKGIRKSFFFSPEPGTRSRVPAWGSAAVSAAQQPPRRPAGVGRGGGSCLGSAWKTGAARGLCHFVAAGRRVTALSPEGGRAQAHAARPPRRRPRPQPGLARRAHGAAWRPPPALRPPESVRAGRRGWGCGGAGRSGAEGSGEERAGPGGFPRQRGRCPSARPAGLLLGAASGEALRSVGRGEACSDLTATSPEFSRR